MAVTRAQKAAADAKAARLAKLASIPTVNSPLISQQVFQTVELLEMILHEVEDMKTLLLAQRVDKTFRDTICDSKKLKKALWCRPVPTEDNESWIKLNPLLQEWTTKALRSDDDPMVPFTRMRLRRAKTGQPEPRLCFMDCTRTRQMSGIPSGSWQNMLVAQTAGRDYRCKVHPFLEYSSKLKRDILVPDRKARNLLCKRDTTMRQLVDKVKEKDAEKKTD